MAGLNGTLLSRILDELSSSGVLSDLSRTELLTRADGLSEGQMKHIVAALELAEGAGAFPEQWTDPMIVFDPPTSIGGAIIARAA